MVQWPSDEVQRMWHTGEFSRGATEPWTARLVAALAASIKAVDILETGTFLGTTTAWLMASCVSPANITSVDVSDSNSNDAVRVLDGTPAIPDVEVTIRVMDALEYIRSLDDESLDFVFLDDDHDADHVDEELAEVIPKVRFGGIIAVHDVIGPFGLDEVVRRHGGFCLKLPKLHKAGGLGIMQR